MSVKKSIAAMLRDTAEKLEKATEGEKERDQLKLAAQGQLENGTTIATPQDEWAEGVDVFVVPNEGDPFPLAEGTYTLDNGATLVVEEEGVVASITSAGEEGEGEGEGGDSDEMKKDDKKERKEMNDGAVKSIVEKVITEHKFASADKVEQLNDVISAQTELITKLSEEVQKLNEPIKQRETKKTPKKKITKKDTSKMSNEERASYLREIYNS